MVSSIFSVPLRPICLAACIDGITMRSLVIWILSRYRVMTQPIILQNTCDQWYWRSCLPPHIPLSTCFTLSEHSCRDNGPRPYKNRIAKFLCGVFQPINTKYMVISPKSAPGTLLHWVQPMKQLREFLPLILLLISFCDMGGSIFSFVACPLHQKESRCTHEISAWKKHQRNILLFERHPSIVPKRALAYPSRVICSIF